ncbi:hypothetical protein KUTeg_020065 [Tegillarca granosa]|uniref:Uncharacterized protein n=1 Tax=Tegillarca granosa TaxID=220873 RepID=A0ABQ9ECU3_TEGGR|nr:hypothetical protein KUTeg_020065 [Tegillarca granosa]
MFKAELDQLEQYSGRNAIRIAGIKENSEESTNNIVLDIAKRAKLDITFNDLDRSHRVGQVKQGTQRQIIAKFTNYRAKLKLMKARKYFRKSGDTVLKSVYINEDLTKARSKLYNAAREYVKNKHCNKCWTWDGKVFVTDRNDRKFRIDSIRDLLQFSATSLTPRYNQTPTTSSTLSYADALSATSKMTTSDIQMPPLNLISTKKNDSARRKPSATVSSADTDKRVSGRQYFQRSPSQSTYGQQPFRGFKQFSTIRIPTVDRHMTSAICVDGPATGGETVENLEQTRHLQTRNKDINDNKK